MATEKKKQSDAYAARKLFLKKLDELKIHYVLEEERPVVRIHYNGTYFRDVTFAFVFDEDGLSIGLRVFSIAQFKKSELMDAYEFCNRINSEYRWVRFYIDGDRELTASLDAVVSPETTAAVCHQLLARAVNIVDSVCRELNK